MAMWYVTSASTVEAEPLDLSLQEDTDGPRAKLRTASFILAEYLLFHFGNGLNSENTGIEVIYSSNHEYHDTPDDVILGGRNNTP